MSLEPIRINPWKDFNYYLVRWLCFGAVGGLVTPVLTHAGSFWAAKGQQVLWGLLFGTVCCVAFTLGQNYYNPSRRRGLTWAIGIAVWMGVKFAFYGAIDSLGS